MFFFAHQIHVRIYDIIFKCPSLLLLALQHGEPVPEQPNSDQRVHYFVEVLYQSGLVDFVVLDFVIHQINQLTPLEGDAHLVIVLADLHNDLHFGCELQKQLRRNVLIS